MKKLLLIFANIICAVAVYAQAPDSLNYQTVVRTATGALYPGGTTMGVKFTIRDGSPTGTVVYQELQSLVTSDFSMLNTQIGSGTQQGTATFAGINWGDGKKFLQVEIDPAGGVTYTITPTAQQLASVPYALYAAKTGDSPWNDYAIFEERYTTPGAIVTLPNTLVWYPRDLNSTTSSAGSSITRTANIINLQPGKYYVSGYTTAYNCNAAVCRLHDLTGSTTIIGNTISLAYLNAGAPSVEGVIDINVATSYQLDMMLQTSSANSGGTVGNNAAWPEIIYSHILIQRIK